MTELDSALCPAGPVRVEHVADYPLPVRVGLDVRFQEDVLGVLRGKRGEEGLSDCVEYVDARERRGTQRNTPLCSRTFL